MKDEKDALILELMQDAYDVHIHSFPSHFPRCSNDLELLQEADKYGMKGLVIKSHYDSTASRALLINQISGTRAKAYGGIVLNWSVGGLNPDAVECSARLGASIVWMPTADSLNASIHKGTWGSFTKQPRLTIIDDAGNLKPEIYDILDIAKAYGMTVATGHISPIESLAVCRAGREKDVKMVLTHPEYPCTAMGIETQQQMAAIGVRIEKLWFNVGNGLVTAEYMADTIRKVGAENCFMATDRGQKTREIPTEGLKLFIRAMLDNGIHRDEVSLMIHENAKWVVE